MPPSFARLRLTRRDDPNAFASKRVGDKEKPAFQHAERYENRLCVAVTVIGSFDGEDVLEHVAGHLEADAVIAPAAGARLALGGFQFGLLPGSPGSVRACVGNSGPLRV